MNEFQQHNRRCVVGRIGTCVSCKINGLFYRIDMIEKGSDWLLFTHTYIGIFLEK